MFSSLCFFFDGVPSSEQLTEDKNCFVSSNGDQGNILYYNPLHYESKKYVSRLNRENASQPTKISQNKSCIYSLALMLSTSHLFNRLAINLYVTLNRIQFIQTAVCMVIIWTITLRPPSFSRSMYQPVFDLFEIKPSNCFRFSSRIVRIRMLWWWNRRMRLLTLFTFLKKKHKLF